MTVVSVIERNNWELAPKKSKHAMRTLFALLIALIPSFGHAEVMDKEFSVNTPLVWAFASALVVCLAARFKPLLLLPIAPAIGWIFLGHLSELMDPGAGPAIATEVGRFYVFISWAAPVFVFFSGGAGVFLRRRSVRAVERMK